MKKFLSRLAGFSIGPIVGALISFITTPLLTHQVHPTEYGKAAMFLTLHLWIQSLIYLGMDQAYTREFHEEKDETKLIQNAMLLPLSSAILILGLVLVFPEFFANLLFEDRAEVFPVIAFAILIIFMVFERFILLHIRMHERAVEYSSFNIILRLNVLIIAVAMLFMDRVSFHTVVYSQIFGQLATDIYLVIRYRHLINFRNFRMDKRLIKNMVHFGLPIMIGAVVFSSLNALDRFFLKYYSDAATLGVYQATLKVAGMIGIIKTAFTSFWVPTAYRWHSENRPMRNFQFISELMMLLMTVAFFGIVLCKEVIVWILGPEYSASTYLIGLMVLPQLLYTTSETTTLGIVFSRQSHLNVLVSGLSIVPTILLNILLTPRLGGVGAVTSSAVGFLLFFALRTWFSKRVGFDFPVMRQFVVAGLMFVCGLLNAFALATWWWNIGFFLMALLIQMPVFKTANHLRLNPNYIDFT